MIESKTNVRIDIGGKAYPVGSIYMSVNSTNPSELFGGTWVQLQNRFLLGSGSDYSNGDTGGEATHKLSISEMPSHNHSQTKHRHSMGQDWSTGTGKTSGRIKTSDRTVTTHYTDYQTPAIQYSGGGQDHNNMPPYLVVFMWKRTA